MKALLIAYAAALLLLVALLFTAHSCHTERQERITAQSASTEKDVQIANLRGVNAETSRAVDSCRLQAVKVELAGANLAATLNRATVQTGAVVAAQTEREQRAGVIRGLVANTSLPASRLRDTIYVPGPVQADSELVAAVAKTTLWAAQYQKQRDSLVTANGVLSVENTALSGQVSDNRAVLLRVKGSLLQEGLRGRFLGFGRRRAVLKIAGEIQ